HGQPMKPNWRPFTWRSIQDQPETSLRPCGSLSNAWTPQTLRARCQKYAKACRRRCLKKDVPDDVHLVTRQHLSGRRCFALLGRWPGQFVESLRTQLLEWRHSPRVLSIAIACTLGLCCDRGAIVGVVFLGRVWRFFVLPLP